MRARTMTSGTNRTQIVSVGTWSAGQLVKVFQLILGYYRLLQHEQMLRNARYGSKDGANLHLQIATDPLYGDIRVEIVCQPEARPYYV